MDLLCGLNGGRFTALAANARGDPEATFAACYINGDPHQEIVADWAKNYSKFSENVPRIGRLPIWQLTHNEELFTAAEKRASPMYNEFQPKYDCRDQVAVVVDRRSDHRRGGGFLMWTMANGESEWEPDKLKRIHSLLPHIRQAVRVRQELAAAEAYAYADVSTLLEHASLGAIFLDRGGGPLPPPTKPQNVCWVSRTAYTSGEACCGPASHTTMPRSATWCPQFCRGSGTCQSAGLYRCGGQPACHWSCMSIPSRPGAPISVRNGWRR